MRDTPSTATDDRTDQFIAAFDDLKWKFGQGINVQALIVAHRLDSTLEGVITLGEMDPSSCVIFADEGLHNRRRKAFGMVAWITS